MPQLGINSQAFYSTNNGSSYTEITDVENINLPDLDGEAVETSKITNAVDTFIAGTFNPGTSTFVVQKTHTNLTALDALYMVGPVSGQTYLVKWKFRDRDTEYVCDGILNKIKLPDLQRKEVEKLTCIVQHSGDWSYNAYS
jgi:hypothetical protein